MMSCTYECTVCYDKFLTSTELESHVLCVHLHYSMLNDDIKNYHNISSGLDHDNDSLSNFSSLFNVTNDHTGLQDNCEDLDNIAVTNLSPCCEVEETWDVGTEYITTKDSCNSNVNSDNDTVFKAQYDDYLNNNYITKEAQNFTNANVDLGTEYSLEDIGAYLEIEASSENPTGVECLNTSITDSSDCHQLNEEYIDSGVTDRNINLEPTGAQEDTKTFECHSCKGYFVDYNKFILHVETCNHGLQAVVDPLVSELQSVEQDRVDATEICLGNNESFPVSQLSNPNQNFVQTKLTKFVCPICSQWFRYESLYLLHQMRHNTKECKMYQCEICKREFRCKTQLNKHIAAFHIQGFNCCVCKRNFTTKEYLKKHKEKHDGEKYGCSLCKRMFKKRCTLRNHEKIHKGESPYICTTCKRGFMNERNLGLHMMRHRGLKPYTCNYCDKGYVSNSALHYHFVNKHSSQKPFRCEVCGKGFSCNGVLIAHAKSHRDERPFGCYMCSMTFTNEYGLKKHEKSHAQKSENQCHICGHTFDSPDALKRHIEMCEKV